MPLKNQQVVYLNMKQIHVKRQSKADYIVLYNHTAILEATSEVPSSVQSDLKKADWFFCTKLGQVWRHMYTSDSSCYEMYMWFLKVV